MNKIEMIRQMAIKAGIANGTSTAVPMYKLESFADNLLASYQDYIASELEKQPLNDTACSIAAWIRGLK